MIQVPPGPAIPVLSDAQNSAEVAVAAGQVLEVRLSTRPGTGYAWQVVQGPPAVTVIRQGYGPAPGPYLRTRNGQLGQQVFDVRAPSTPGRIVALALAYRPVGRRLAFARIWRIRLSIGPAPASLSRPRR
ncbi:protease inhibitor I42 family protein [Caulobacter sp. S45]|uniref:protease inhibitor I42 family protein n=1 Tax=Caulobacter sp. S45 TaxID=1641861 RepID=UPI001577789B|nr:protease inhibitor I42 family protein [Caulobacter sp. S45]